MRSLSFNRPGRARRTRGSICFGIPLQAIQQTKTDAGRQVPILLSEVKNTLLAQGGLAHADALYVLPTDEPPPRRLRDRLETGEPVASVVRTATPSSLVGLLHSWVEAIPGGLFASAQPELDALLQGTTPEFSPPALLQACRPPWPLPRFSPPSSPPLGPLPSLLSGRGVTGPLAQPSLDEEGSSV